MSRNTANAFCRLNITLPEKTVRLIDRVATKRGRSGFIAEAIECHLAEIDRTNLRRRIKEGAVRRADRDLGVAREWSAMEEETWQVSRR